MDHHRNIFQQRVGFDFTRQGKAVHLRHFQVGQHQCNLIGNRHTFSLSLRRQHANFLPCVFAGDMQLRRDLHRLQTFFQHRACHFRVFGDNRDGTGLDVEFRGLQIRGMQVVVGRGDVIQDLLNVEHHRQLIGIGLLIQTGDTGDVPPADGSFRRVHLLPVKTHDVLNGFHRKSLHAAGIFRDQQDVQPGGWLTARHGSQVDYRDNLIANIHHAHQR